MLFRPPNELQGFVVKICRSRKWNLFM
jgi:hypothetical protein